MLQSDIWLQLRPRDDRVDTLELGGQSSSLVDGMESTLINLRRFG